MASDGSQTVAGMLLACAESEMTMSQQTISTICSNCSTGCNLDIEVDDHSVQSISGSSIYPVNQGKVCAKCLAFPSPSLSNERGTVPLLNTAQGMKPIEWDEALEIFCSRMKAIQAEHGLESVAYLSNGRFPTEETALLGAFAKFGMGIVHGDSITDPCMSSAAMAYKLAFGFVAPPCTFKDLEESDTLIFVGANPVASHPILWSRVMMNENDPKIIVLDTTCTETAHKATHHYQLSPHSDLVLLRAVANQLIQRDWIDRGYIDKYTEGFEVFRAHVSEYTMERAKTASGLSTKQVDELVKLIHEGKRVSFWWSTGNSQSHQGIDTALAMINIVLMTGNIGRPGTGANVISEECNALGSKLFSNITNLLGGHDFTNCRHRRKIAAILNISESRIPDHPSQSYAQILELIKVGGIKALWVLAANPAESWIKRHIMDEIREKLEFVVVQDISPTSATSRCADLYLPSATSVEKEGTFINAERRLGHVSKILNPPGHALSDFDIILRITDKWGCSRWVERWSTPELVFQTLKKLSAGQPCDITGIHDYNHLDEEGGIQWPLCKGDLLESNERRLFEDGVFFHKDGKARFAFSHSQEVASDKLFAPILHDETNRLTFPAIDSESLPTDDQSASVLLAKHDES